MIIFLLMLLCLLGSGLTASATSDAAASGKFTLILFFCGWGNNTIVRLWRIWRNTHNVFGWHSCISLTTTCFSEIPAGRPTTATALILIRHVGQYLPISFTHDNEINKQSCIDRTYVDMNRSQAWVKSHRATFEFKTFKCEWLCDNSKTQAWYYLYDSKHFQ